MPTHLAFALPDTGASPARMPPATAGGLSPVDTLPWLSATAPAPGSARGGRRAFGPGHAGPVFQAGLALAFAALVGAAYLLPGDDALPPVPGDAGGVALTPAAPLSAGSGTGTARGTGKGQALVDAALSLIGVPERSGPRAGAARPKPVTGAPIIVRAPRPLPRVAPAPVAEQPLAPPSPPAGAMGQTAAADEGADMPVTRARLKEFRSTMDACRDAVRDVIRLGERQRPGRNASAGDLTGHKLRQQNAEAARTYRSYLDTLARSMRGKVSDATARQALERARQTLAYLETMRADSSASLR